MRTFHVALALALLAIPAAADLDLLTISGNVSEVQIVRFEDGTVLDSMLHVWVYTPIQWATTTLVRCLNEHACSDPATWLPCAFTSESKPHIRFQGVTIERYACQQPTRRDTGACVLANGFAAPSGTDYLDDNANPAQDIQLFAYQLRYAPDCSPKP